MKNKLQDLNNYLFESIERLMNDDLTNEQLEAEIARSNAVVNVAGAIVKNGGLVLKGYAYAAEANVDAAFPALLAGE